MDVKTAIQARRAYRSLAPVQITKELVEDLASAASLAPSCFNKQPWRFVFVYGREALSQLHPALSKGNEWAREASLIIAVFSKKELDCVMKDGREYYSVRRRDGGDVPDPAGHGTGTGGPSHRRV